jgi:hypothetical protein
MLLQTAKWLLLNQEMWKWNNKKLVLILSNTYISKKTLNDNDIDDDYTNNKKKNKDKNKK